MLGAIGAIGGALLGASSARSVNRQSMAFQKEAMQNKHQWGVADMKAAGLNPILSATGGAPSAGGAPSVNLKQPFSAKDADAMSSAIKKANADTELVKAQTAAVKADTPKKETKGIFYEGLGKPAASAAVQAVKGSVSMHKKTFEAIADQLGTSANKVKQIYKAVISPKKPRTKQQIKRDKSNMKKFLQRRNR